MRRRMRWAVVALVAGLAVSACAETSESTDEGEGAAELVPVEGSDVPQVVVTERAVERLDIQLAEVTPGSVGTTTIPYAAVVYDPEGATWVYTSPEPLTFVRTPITVLDITGDRAVLSAGPQPGTEVVTVGTAELFGTEEEIGH
jgi:hypothetical protein